MRKEILLELLATNEAFVGLSHDALDVVLHAGALRHWVRDDFLIRQGQDAALFALIVRGTAKLIQVTPDGHQVLIRFIGRGQEFGLIAALDGFVYPLSIQAVEPCSAMVWQGAVLVDLMQRLPTLALNALRIMVIRNQETQRRYQELLTQRVEQRVAQALIRLADQLGRAHDGTIRIELALTREDLGEFAGTTQYSVSRVLSAFERSGLIDAQRERILILQIDELRHLAGLEPSGADLGSVACGAACFSPQTR